VGKPALRRNEVERTDAAKRGDEKPDWRQEIRAKIELELIAHMFQAPGCWSIAVRAAIRSVAVQAPEARKKCVFYD